MPGQVYGRTSAEDISALSYAELTDKKAKEAIGDITFVTATDGNHGRGIAWTAAKLGQKAVVYMPKGSAAERQQNIQKLGAVCEITDVNYDDTVRFAKQQAEEKGRLAETKMTLPLMIMLVVLIMISVSPALMEI